NRLLQMNDARHVEDNNTRPGGFATFAESSRAAVSEIRHDINSSTATAKREFPCAFRARERRHFRLWKIVRLARPGNKWFPLLFPFGKRGCDVGQDFLLVLLELLLALLVRPSGNRPAFAG